MRTRFDSYDHLLRLQTRILYPFEQPLYRTNLWRQATQVLDFGCGNAAYAHRLTSDNPDKAFICLDSDPQMTALAQERYGQSGLQIITGSYATLPADRQFDFFLSRFVTVHLTARQALCAWAASRMPSGSGVLVLDADLAHFQIAPQLPIFQQALARLQSQFPDPAQALAVRTLVEQEWSQAGFEHLGTQRIIVNSALPNMKELMYLYMCLSAEMAFGAPLPTELSEELFAWVLDPASYVQYGVFAASFVRKP